MLGWLRNGRDHTSNPGGGRRGKPTLNIFFTQKGSVSTDVVSSSEGQEGGGET